MHLWAPLLQRRCASCVQVGFLYLRYLADPKTLWQWVAPFVKDPEVRIRALVKACHTKHTCTGRPMLPEPVCIGLAMAGAGVARGVCGERLSIALPSTCALVRSLADPLVGVRAVMLVQTQ